jgi:hypothetical protein
MNFPVLLVIQRGREIISWFVLWVGGLVFQSAGFSVSGNACQDG